MKVLGISPLDKDATVSFVEDGEILFAAGEERYSRQKQHSGFPYEALADGLRYLGWSPADLDIVAYAFLSADREETVMAENVGESLKRTYSTDWRLALDAARQTRSRSVVDNVPGLTDVNESLEKGWAKRISYRLLGTSPVLSAAANRYLARDWLRRSSETHKRMQAQLHDGLNKFGIEAQLRWFEHHITHAANAYYCSGYDRALIVSLDGYGSGLAGAVSIGEGGKIKRLQGLRFPHSLGKFFEHATTCLGYRADRHAGKIVGLAAYGDPERLSPLLMDRFYRQGGNFEIIESFNYFFSRYLGARFSKIDVAAAYQNVLELVASDLVQYWADKTGCEKVVLSGGVAASVRMNQRIFEVDGVGQMFVYPNMGVGGCSTGAALHADRETGVQRSFQSAYLGPEFSEDQIADALRDKDLSFTRPDNLAAAAAKCINAGKVLARFDGRMGIRPARAWEPLGDLPCAATGD